MRHVNKLLLSILAVWGGILATPESVRSDETEGIIFIVSLPYAIEDTYSVAENETLSVPAASGLLSNDFHSTGLAFSVNLILDGVDNGSVTVFQDGRLEYTPDTDFNGTDQMTYRIRDINGKMSISTATFYVQEDPNRAPVAGDDLYFFQQGITLTVLAEDGLVKNDRDPDGDSLTISVILDSTDDGTLTVFPAGNFTYTPDNGFAGTDSFQYRLRDSNGGFDSAVVTLTNSNRAPVAITDFYGVGVNKTLTMPVDRGVLYNDFDPDGQELQVVLITDGTEHGSLNLFPDGRFSYTPDKGYSGHDGFVYRILDESGQSATATVHLFIGNAGPGALNELFKNGFEIENKLSEKPDTKENSIVEVWENQ